MDNYDSHCPRCGTWLDMPYLESPDGEYGDYYSQEFECPHCHAPLTINTEKRDVITYKQEE